MTTYIGLLRGVNVGGHGKVGMAELRDLLSRLGFGESKSLLQSGNLIFQSEESSASKLEKMLETETARHLGIGPAYFIRTSKQWENVIAKNPFPGEARRDPARLHVLCLKSAPDPGDVKMLQAAITGPELIRAHGREAFIVYPNGAGTSKVTNVLIERTLKTRATARNWNTVLKIGALAGI
jgi:uncharacterized protein (DUF1697 family)